jgi:hypothetical protein
MLINLSFDGVMRVHIMLISVSEDRELTESSLAPSFVIKFFFSLVGHDMACLLTLACLPAFLPACWLLDLYHKKINTKTFIE